MGLTCHRARGPLGRCCGMRIPLAAALLATLPAWAADPAPSTAASSALTPCADCGVVRSVRYIKKEIVFDPEMEARPSGLVATFPLGGGKPQVGSSMKLGRDKPEYS